jgi:hypothetical protein
MKGIIGWRDCWRLAVPYRFLFGQKRSGLQEYLQAMLESLGTPECAVRRVWLWPVKWATHGASPGHLAVWGFTLSLTVTLAGRWRCLRKPWRCFGKSETASASAMRSGDWG